MSETVVTGFSPLDEESRGMKSDSEKQELCTMSCLSQH